ncbi:flagellar motor switch protein FliN [Aliifodinibius salipaludis]|uniref:Flagellar motor switch protein FliN n=1 Tax=Fodinibius salipaludis TaxID=2032627 RepID=A0A2A2GC98_9BACT|nr:flagellar motor switch protein FliN [Aliifodinibius salipaludis]PAU94614.1 flagellar motor switch protein FliN [Aliifodinibius salipaludis]
MDILKENLEQYVPTIEEFLTSILLEETDIEVDAFEEVENEIALEHLNNTDVYLYAREQNISSDVIIVLDQEWFGLLSSIMLGIEEKEKNEQTIGLLEEFADDLADAIKEEAASNDLEFEFSEVKVLSKVEMQEELAHEKYIWTKLDIEGIADEVVRAEFLLGDPETEIEKEEIEEPAEDEEDEFEEETLSELSSLEEEDDEDFSSINTRSEPKERKKEKVISARHIEFAEFAEENGNGNGEVHSMDLLKDVDLDVSVELGRIELPLGKVLELAKGSVIELEKLAGEPVDILVNGNRIALGEVVVIDEHFGVRISSLVTTKKRLAKIKNGPEG